MLLVEENTGPEGGARSGWRLQNDATFAFKIGALVKIMSGLLESKMLSLSTFLQTHQVPLLTVDQVPCDVREVAIIGGYRPTQTTAVQAVASVFNATNETLNVWTHFIPTWYFVWQFGLLCQQLNVYDQYTWAYLSFMVTCCVYPFASCTAHTFSTMSDKARHMCYFLDYGALSLYSYGVAVLYRGYSLPLNFYENQWADIYLLLCFLSCVMCTMFACCSRFTTTFLTTKVLRLGAFVLPFMIESTPIFYRLYICQGIECELPSLSYHLWQFVADFLGGTLYALHVPERLAPGRFDIIGHSHQLLHICSVLSTFAQINGGMIDLEARRDLFIRNHWVPSNFWSWGSVLTLFITDALIIAFFSIFILPKELAKTTTDSKPTKYKERGSKTKVKLY